MLAKRFSAIPFLLLLFLVFYFPIPTLAKESSFQNAYYVFSWDEAGNVLLSMATKASEVYINGMKPSQKKADGDLIFWFDLEPNAVAVIAANKVESITLPK